MKVDLRCEFTKCLICKREFNNSHSLSVHIVRTHKINCEQYLNKFSLFPKCTCGKDVGIFRFGVFNKTCGDCDCINENKKMTNVQKYGSEHIFQSENFKNKSKNTNLKKYGSELYSQSKENKIDYKKAFSNQKITNIKKYGVDNQFKRNEIKKDIKIKSETTCLKKYGKRHYSSTDEYKIKVKNTNLKRFGATSWMGNKELYSKFIETKRKNKTLKSSNSEEKLYKSLIELFPSTKRNYKSDLYPYCCDFYITEKNLYIELNLHWTHGGMPYNPRLKKHKEQLELWKSKNTKFYNNAIETWTVRDVKKRNIAKENNLNYLEIFDKNEEMWLTHIKRA